MKKRDKFPKVSTTDKKILESMQTGEGLIPISQNELLSLAEAAKKTHERFGEEIRKIMNRERAEFVKKLRVEEECTWRAVAEHCHAEWGAEVATWQPPSNQLAGMQLCATAGEILGEIVD